MRQEVNLTVICVDPVQSAEYTMQAKNNEERSVTQEMGA